MLRTVFFDVVMFVVTSLLAPTAVAARLLLDEQRRTTVQQWCMHSWARAALWCAGVSVVLHGEEHIEHGRGTIYASNHVSWFDVFAIASVLPEYTFVAKAELRRIPIFGWGAEGAGVVFLARENRKSAFAAYEQVAHSVREGMSVVVCPEGTRGKDYHLRPFKKGPFVLAVAAEAPVVPVVVYGAREVMPKGAWRIKPGRIHVHLLPPVETAGYDYDHRHELMARVWGSMALLLRDTYGVDSDEQPYAPEIVETSA